MNIVIWHVHGSWTTAFVQGRHTYRVPVTPARDADGLGRARTWIWPPNVIERTPRELRSDEIDLVVLQRERDEILFREWTGRTAGRDVPAVWLEHNAPQGRIADMRHPAADRRDLTVVHVTHTNQLFWDCGSTRSVVIEHGIIDPGYLFSGDVPRVAVVVNEPVRRQRVVGTDLLQRLSTAAPLDLFGMDTAPLASLSISVHEVPTQHDLHLAMARRCAYLHPVRWTSLGLSLIEAMHLGLPVVALATTEVPDAVPRDAGVVSNRVDVLEAALRCFVNDREAAIATGKAARVAALDRFGLDRFLSEWNDLIDEVTS
jgi:hypothetical protein